MNNLRIFSELAIEQLPVGTSVTKTGVVTKIIFQNDSGYFVYSVTDLKAQPFVVLGIFPAPLCLGRYYALTGTVEQRSGKRELAIETYQSIDPSGDEEIIALLERLPGLNIGARRFYKAVGETVLQEIRDYSALVLSAAKALSISADTVRMWREYLLRYNTREESMRILLDAGFNLKTTRSILDAHGDNVGAAILENPYLILSLDEAHVLFPDCDRMALSMGYPLDGSCRIREAIRYCLNSYSQQTGGTCAPSSVFADELHNCLDVVISRAEALEIINTHSGDQAATITIGKSKVPVLVSDLKTELSLYDEEQPDEPFQYVANYCPDERLLSVITEMMEDGSLTSELIDGENHYQLQYYSDTEKSIAATLARQTSSIDDQTNPAIIDHLVRAVLSEIGSEMNPIVLEAGQRQAVDMVCARRGGAYIITGPAGSGKTFILKIIIAVLDKYARKTTGSGLNVTLLAPTGKAAKVAGNATGLRGSTIHRFLSAMETGAAAPSGLYVIDEFSMVDEALFASFLCNLPESAKLILLGDTQQLPSIGVGNCLYDLIHSGVIPHLALNVVKRQSEKSGILLMANHICAGEKVKSEITNRQGNDDNAVVSYSDTELDVRRRIIGSAVNLGLDSFMNERVQILCPRNGGNTGAVAINHILQQKMNPWSPDSGKMRAAAGIEARYYDDNGRMVTAPIYYNVGDRVIHTKNDYKAAWYSKDSLGSYALSIERGVMNGEMGVIEDITNVLIQGQGQVRRVIVRYGDRFVFYDGDAVKSLLLAYAITIHRSQGSQWPIILSPITQRDGVLLTRQLLYTACTRAQKTLLFVAQPGVIDAAVQNEAINNRTTLLKQRLISAADTGLHNGI